MIYRIRIQGDLDQSWVDWLGDVRIFHEAAQDGCVMTTITADFIDQSLLFGVLDRVRDLNLVLLSVQVCDEKGK